MRKKEKVNNAICLWCEKPFYARPWDVKRGRGKYCSVQCKEKAGRSVQDTFGRSNPNWKGGRSYDQSNYDELRREWRKNNPEAYSAHKKFDYAVRHGVVVRPENCQSCGTECRPDGHHEDYSLPLSVEWLCRSCHIIKHQRPVRAE